MPKHIEILNKKAEKDNKIMHVMRLIEVSHEVCKTDKGELRLKLHKGGTGKDYRFTLDTVPLGNETNNDLLELFADIL